MKIGVWIRCLWMERALEEMDAPGITDEDGRMTIAEPEASGKKLKSGTFGKHEAQAEALSRNSHTTFSYSPGTRNLSCPK